MRTLPAQNNEWALYSKPFYKRQRFAQLGKERFFGFEFTRVHTATQASHPHWMFQVQHFVVKQVFDRVARARGAVKNSADHNRVVRCVVVTQRMLGHSFAPRKLGPAQEPQEEARIERIENFFEIVKATLRPGIALTATGVANHLNLAGYHRTCRESLKAQVLQRIDGLLIEFREQDVRNGVKNALRRTFHQI